ncbi:MAG: SDR family oxidoreductase [Candidatus Eisenbacteria bacterium]|nr:SDR family oxidoreductase [Candidatus Eisenbacteria bacterium]
MAIEADVSDFARAEEVVQQVVESWGRLDILVCNAGITRDGVSWKMTEEQWDTVLDVNLKGYFNYCRAAAQVFKAQESGKIVNVASINGIRGKFGQANYSASKGGGIALSKALARELGRFNVNVNVVAPGMVMTEMARSIPQKFLDAATGETVLGRVADPEDIANVVTFLCSNLARHVTGEVIKVDGGQYI